LLRGHGDEVAVSRQRDHHPSILGSEQLGASDGQPNPAMPKKGDGPGAGGDGLVHRLAILDRPTHRSGQEFGIGDDDACEESLHGGAPKEALHSAATGA
jgi:hypothetical protein